VVVAFSNLIESYPTRHGKIQTGLDHAGGIGVHGWSRTVIAAKPRARRRQDLLDVVELVNAGADVRRVRQYLEQYAGDLLAVFGGLVEEALEG
jgi:hypothetical protein